MLGHWYYVEFRVATLDEEQRREFVVKEDCINLFGKRYVHGRCCKEKPEGYLEKQSLIM